MTACRGLVEQLLLKSNEPWDGVGGTCLEVVGLTSSALPVEPAAGWPQGGEAAVVARALLEPSCVPKALLPGAAWPLSLCHGPECFVAYQSQCQHRCCTPRCTCWCPKRGSGGGCPGQRRSCTATAARAWRSKGDTGCAKCQRTGWPWQSPCSLLLMPEPVGRQVLL